MAVRERKDVWKLNEWDPILLWYAKGIRVMQARPVTEPTSWRYQAAIHDYDPNDDPLAHPGETLPSASEQQQFWAQCQHFSWFFLSWHRMYLLYFEQIVGEAIAGIGGPAEWALPYWNYSDQTNPNAAKLPPAFRDATLPDGTPNPLRVEQRLRGNDAGVVGRPVDVNISTCLSEFRFAAQTLGGNQGFGGPKTLFNHAQGNPGKIETTPHGNMHVRVGGWMGGFNTAGLDPIFWLHHANIDRLWSVWQKRDSQDVNPTDTKWLTQVAFEFHDAQGSVISLTSGQVVDTTAGLLSYKYEDESDPLATAFAAPGSVTVGEENIPEMVGATSEPIRLGTSPVSTQLSVSPPSGPAAARAFGAAPPRMYLNIENVTTTGSPRNYSVYLNSPEGASADIRAKHYAGEMPTFGARESSRPDATHPGGVHYTFEVTGVVRSLEAAGSWDPARVQVTFVPEEDLPSAAFGTAEPPPIHVGRVSIYAQ